MGRYILILLVLLVSGTTPSWAVGSYVAGQEAYRVKDYTLALREFKADDSPRAWYMIGVMHENGEGVGKNPKEAAEWYRKAADAGLATAQYRLGRLYLEGEGVAQDRKEAVRLYRKAAEQGFGVAKYALKALEE